MRESDRKPYAAAERLGAFIECCAYDESSRAKAMADLDRLAGLLQECDDFVCHDEFHSSLAGCRGCALLAKLRAERGEGQ